MPRYIAAIDQGTTSTRCILFDRDGPVASAQKEHRQIFPRPGWVEHDPLEIWQRTQQVIREARAAAGAAAGDIAAVGIANQRETTVVWSKSTGKPFGNAIVWQDTRTQEICDRLAAQSAQASAPQGPHSHPSHFPQSLTGPDRFRHTTGLPLATYFSGPKLRWMLENDAALRAAADEGDALFGTIDSWLIWQLTGGARNSASGGVHVIDVTNASRTMLMNIHTLNWDDALLAAFETPRQVLPRIVASSEPAGYGVTDSNGPFEQNIPICGDLGDQQAALVGQACFSPGDSKNTYGTGCFLLLNTGPQAIPSQCGLLTTVGYQFSGSPAVYALEGSVAVTGALVQWLRDNLGIIQTSADIEPLARSVSDNGGVYFVPAFSGLFAPYWRGDARGVIAGLTRFATKAHLARAALEATAYQTRDILQAMRRDAGVLLATLKVDGGMAVNDLLMQFQSDILDIPVIRPRVSETTALGAAYAAGLAIGFWTDLADLKSRWQQDRRWEPKMPEPDRERLYAKWKKAVERSFGWV